MSALDDHPFLKMNGLGNEIVVLDLRASPHVVTAGEARAIALDPRSRFDQLMVLHAPVTAGTDAFMRIYNTDGSLSASCGNGTRCVAWALMRDTDRTALTLETSAGLLACERVDATHFSVDMGPPRLAWSQIPLGRPMPDTRAIDFAYGPAGAPPLRNPAAVSMGNPHAVFFVEDIGAYDLAAIGPAIEHDPLFPERVNVSLAHAVSPEHIVLKVWERGTGLTRACGSAACAALVAAARRGLTGRRARVTLPGGDLVIDWRGQGDDGHVVMTGPVELEWEGRFSPALFRGAA